MGQASARFRIPKLLGIIAICSCLFGLYRLRSDLAYFFKAPKPIDTTLAQLSDLPENSYVQVSGHANYRRSALVEGRYSGFDHIFEITSAPISTKINTSTEELSIFVEQNRKQRVSKAELNPVISGRLLKFSDRIYAKKLSDLFSKHAAAGAVDAHAMVIVANLKPREHWLRLALAILLLAMIAFNAYALSRPDARTRGLIP